MEVPALGLSDLQEIKKLLNKQVDRFAHMISKIVSDTFSVGPSYSSC